ncbi:DUF6132 family protein [Melioribacteraceae bacterium 4301-Me]|uniref:DUF6132 family protein n=1 Tax=Pyranulibacter aquaticus TaxID=3163344 RepID=UPI00359B58D7
MKHKKIFFIRRILPVFVGALLGYAYYYFIGCYNGKCLISGNPYVATLYGAIIGALLTFPSSTKRSIEDAKENNKRN